MTITSVIKDGGRLVIVEDGITKTRSIVYDDAVCSLPPTGYTEVGVIYVDEDNSKLVIQYNGTTAEIELDAAGDLTGAEIVALLQALAADDRLEVTYLKDGTTYIKYTATEKTKLADIEDNAKDDQTGAEIMALLEALTVGNRLSHSKLDDVGASDHHSKYTNAEAVTAMGVKGDSNPLHHDKYTDAKAKAAAVQAGAITDGVTKAPTHDAVHDVKATADAALPADEKYTDEDAVDAMGVKADDNPLNHDQAEEWGATEHSAIGDNAPHHTKYTDANAVAAVKAGNYVPRTYMWFVGGTVATGTEQGPTFRMKRATIVESIDLHVKTAPTGAALIIDINEGGTTLLDDGDSGVKPTIAIDGTTEDDNEVFTDTALAIGAELTMDIDQVGSTEAGKDLTVLLHCKEAVI